MAKLSDRERLLLLEEYKKKYSTNTLGPFDVNIVEAVCAPPPSIDYVLPGLPLGEIGLIVAPGGTGKSFLTLQSAIGIATHTEIAGGLWPVTKPGRVIILSLEDSLIFLGQRLYYIAQTMPEFNMGILELLRENLIIRSYAGHRSAYIDSLGELIEDFEQEITAIATGARLLIVDPLRRFHDGDENSSSDVTKIVSVLERIAHKAGCAVIATHHANKTFSGTSQNNARGSSALSDNVRWQINLSHVDQEELENLGFPGYASQYIRVSMPKVNYGMHEQNCILVRGENGVLTKPEKPEPKWSTGGYGRRKG